MIEVTLSTERLFGTGPIPPTETVLLEHPPREGELVQLADAAYPLTVKRVLHRIAGEAGAHPEDPPRAAHHAIHVVLGV